MNIEFDNHGNPYPYEIIILQHVECRDFFTSIADSRFRLQRWNEFERFHCDLTTILSHPVKRWIDGSFTTTKKQPKDIDVVTFVNYLDFKPELVRFDMNITRGVVKSIYNVDSYLVFTVPFGHQNHPDYIARMDYWKKHFGHDRQKRPKALIEVQYG